MQLNLQVTMVLSTTRTVNKSIHTNTFSPYPVIQCKCIYHFSFSFFFLQLQWPLFFCFFKSHNISYYVEVTCVSSRFKKTSVELYEVRARGQMRSLRSSQISTHLGLDGRRRSPALPTRPREQLSQSNVAPPAFSSQGPSIKPVQEQDRYSLLDYQTVDLNV